MGVEVDFVLAQDQGLDAVGEIAHVHRCQREAVVLYLFCCCRQFVLLTFFGHAARLKRRRYPLQGASLGPTHDALDS